MSKENLERFMTQVAESEELKARIGEEIDADALIALGAEHGCEFSAEDLAADAELSDEQLEAVAGGLIAVVIITAYKGGEGEGDSGRFRFRVSTGSRGSHVDRPGYPY